MDDFDVPGKILASTVNATRTSVAYSVAVFNASAIGWDQPTPTGLMGTVRSVNCKRARSVASNRSSVTAVANAEGISALVWAANYPNVTTMVSAGTQSVNFATLPSGARNATDRNGCVALAANACKKYATN